MPYELFIRPSGSVSSGLGTDFQEEIRAYAKINHLIIALSCTSLESFETLSLNDENITSEDSQLQFK